MRFNFRKIATALTSTALVGSTIALAAAASFPEPFVDGGAADVAVVYGNSLDLPAVTDISAALNAATSTTSSGSSSGSTPDGEFVELNKNSNKINLGDTISGVFGTSADEDDLPTLLADGEYSADDNDDFDYEQKVTLPSWTLSHFRDSDYETLVGLDERTPAVGFNISSSTFMLNYTLDFTSDAESDVASGDFEDFEGSDMPLLGKTYYVSDAKNGSSSTYLGKITLLDSATTGIVNEGETITLTVDGTTYDVSINFIGSTSVKYDINGEVTNTLSVGETYKLSDGTFVGVREINVQDYAGGLKNTEFSLGSGKVEMTSGSEIKLNDETVEGVIGYAIRGSANDGHSLDKVVIEWTSDDEHFLTGASDVTIPGFEGLTFSMNDLVRSDEEKLSVEHDSDTSVELKAPIKDGMASFNFLYANSDGNFSGIGKASDERLATTNESQLTFWEKQSGSDYHEWFVASYASGEESESYLLRALVTEEDSIDKVTIRNVVTGSDVCEDKQADDTCDIGDVTLTFNYVTKDGGNENVTMSINSGGSFDKLYTDGGLRVQLPYEVGNITVNNNNGAIDFDPVAADFALNGAGHSMDTFYLHMTGEDKDDTIAAGTDFYFTINDNSDDELQVSQLNGAGTGGSGGKELGDDSSTYEAYIYDEVAPRILHYTNGDQDYAEVYYPEGNSESYAEVFLAGSGSSGGSTTTSGGLSVMDTELVSSGMSTKNLVVVGGSCVNSVAAQLVGVPSDTCGAAWTAATTVGAGSYVIETFTSPYSASKVATLVAGYEQADTANAATYLRTQNPTTDVGAKYTGTTGTSATMVGS